MQHDKDYDQFLIKLSQKIKAARKARGLTQEDMTDYGFNYRHYQRIESGKYSPSLHTIYRISLVLKIKISKLLE